MGINVGSSPASVLTDNASQSATSSQGASFSSVSSQDLANGMGLGSGFKSGLASSSDWKDTLRPVRFKGVEFPATQIKNTSGRKLVKHVYPYRDGQELVDLGRELNRVRHDIFAIPKKGTYHGLILISRTAVKSQQFSIRIRTIFNMALDNSSRLLYKTLRTYNRISSVYELSLSTRIASPDLQRPCGVFSLNR